MKQSSAIQRREREKGKMNREGDRQEGKGAKRNRERKEKKRSNVDRKK